MMLMEPPSRWRNSQATSVNGARGTQNNFEINGIDANRLSSNDAGPLAVPAPETIQEFKVLTSLYDATFGRGAGGSVQEYSAGVAYAASHALFKIERSGTRIELLPDGAE